MRQFSLTCSLHTVDHILIVPTITEFIQCFRLGLFLIQRTKSQVHQTQQTSYQYCICVHMLLSIIHKTPLRSSSNLHHVDSIDDIRPSSKISFPTPSLCALILTPATTDSSGAFATVVSGFSVTAAAFALRSTLLLSPRNSKCGLITIVYLTNSSTQSTNLPRLPVGNSLLVSSPRS